MRRRREIKRDNISPWVAACPLLTTSHLEETPNQPQHGGEMLPMLGRGRPSTVIPGAGTVPPMPPSRTLTICMSPQLTRSATRRPLWTPHMAALGGNCGARGSLTEDLMHRTAVRQPKLHLRGRLGISRVSDSRDYSAGRGVGRSGETSGRDSSPARLEHLPTFAKHIRLTSTGKFGCGQPGTRCHPNT